MYNIITLKNQSQHQLIHDVILHPLKVNSDPRGTLTEALKTSWEPIYSSDRPFTQMYFSTTKPGVARDVDQWHYHPGGQEDRFGTISGDIVAAIYDNRDDSKTLGALNLFAMGESQGPDGQYLLLVPKQTNHGFVVVSAKPATLFNFPTRLYDPKEEVRLPFAEHKLPDKTVFDWEKAKKAYSSQ